MYDVGESTKRFLPPLIASLTDGHMRTDKMPKKLNIKLRENRPDINLPDGHGDVWMTLVAQSENEPTLLSASNSDLKATICSLLDLSAQRSFPKERISTLWRNARWRDLITNWCRTGYGRTTFNISAWAEMIGTRLDEVLIYHCFICKRFPFN